MYKILIVDDNPLILMGIKNMIEWDKFHAALSGEANNVSHALELINEKKPDLVITDIRMPGKNGLYLLNEINAKYPEISTIVISAYDDFQYAKEAMKANCTNYILKPIDPKELNSTISKTIDSKAAKNTDIQSFVGEIAEGSIYVLKTKRNYSVSEIYDILQRKNVEVKKDANCFLIYCHSHGSKEIEDELKAKLTSLFLLGSVKVDPEKKPNELVIEAKKKASEMIFENSRDSYRTISENQLDEKRISIFCTTGNSQKAEEIFKGIVGNVMNDQMRNIEMFINAVNSFLQVLLSLDKETFNDVKRIMDSVEKIPEELSYYSVDEVAGEVYLTVENVCSEYSRALGNKHDLVIKVKNMIEKNYQSELSLFEISRLFYVTPSYLSRVFKQEAGMNLNNYITKTRIDTASQLLRETDEKVVDIAHLVGFSDANYFTKVFKKVTGVAPNNIRNR